MHACQHAQEDDDDDDDDDACHYEYDDDYDVDDEMMTTMMTVIHNAALITPCCVALASASVPQCCPSLHGPLSVHQRRPVFHNMMLHNDDPDNITEADAADGSSVRSLMTRSKFKVNSWR